MPQPPARQRTIAKPASIRGKGLFFGKEATLTFKPAPPHHGVVFCRTDLNNAVIPAQIGNVIKRARRSALRAGDATVDTTEHCLSAVSGMGVDNLLIEIDGPEVPGVDGSARPFVDALLQAGTVEQEAPRRFLLVSEPVMARQDDATIAIMPSDDPGLRIMYQLDYPDDPSIGRQIAVFDHHVDGSPHGDYAGQIAPARTFLTEEEAQYLQSRGVGSHLSPTDVVVFGKGGPIGGNKLRFPDEPVRHKVLDLLGDLALLGAPLQARIVASRTGHTLNHQVVRALVKQLRHQTQHALATGKPEMDVRKLMSLLPHRYPMLLVDRIVEVDGTRRIVGVKNVTINEPFFVGHFSAAPIMPGVLIVEALAQISGVLLGQSWAGQGRIAVLMSLDRVKLRRPVVPGDQLMLEAEAVRLRGTLAHTRCRAYVGQDLAAEAEIKFVIVDPNQT